MLSLNISLPQVQIFLLILVRVIAILLTAPIFNSRNIPVLFKVGLSFAVSLILFPILNLQDLPVRFDAIPLIIGIVSEILIGIIIGLSARMIFVGIQLAGQLVGFQMGLAMANVMDPATSEQMPLLGQLNNLIAMLIFLVTNAHHLFLRALVESFQIVPPFDFHFGSSPGKNDYWHTMEDSLDKLSVDSLHVTGRIVLEMIRQLEQSASRTSRK